MTGRKVSCGRHAHVAGARTARIRSVSSPMDLTHGVAHVHEGVALACGDLVDELLAAGHHLIEHQRQVSVAAWITRRLISGSPPRNARFTRSPGFASAKRRSTALSAVASGMLLGTSPKLPCCA